MDSKFYFQDTLQQQTVAADNKFSFQYTVLTSSQISLGQTISFDPLSAWLSIIPHYTLTSTTVAILASVRYDIYRLRWHGWWPVPTGDVGQ